MTEPLKIDPDALYDDGALIFSLGLRQTAIDRGRKTGELRFTRRGGRTLMLGAWVLEWLTAEPASADMAVAS